MHRVLLVLVLLAGSLALPGAAAAAAERQAAPGCAAVGTCDALHALWARSEALNRSGVRPASGSAVAAAQAAERALAARSEGLNRLHATGAPGDPAASTGTFDWTAALLGAGAGFAAAALAAAALTGLRRRARGPIAH